MNDDLLLNPWIRIAQYLIEAGHRWDDIRMYSLGLLGEFFVAAHQSRLRREQESFLCQWMAVHARDPHKVLQQWRKPAGSKPTEPPPDQVRRDWAMFINALSRLNAGRL